ncbi:interleukin-6 receptor subunit beta-like [Liolophura sinensis]|uniref:interleukin-6 receptor subunit beta-like n=1 Tax=Liolophura sinensis TaxID=3198878 RepID=UPI0031595AE7
MGMYFCIHNNLPDSAHILVGHLPEAPRFISCVSENFENMTCQWDPRKTELCIPIVWTVEYTVKLDIRGVINETTSSFDPPTKKCESWDPNPLTCVWLKDETDVRNAFKPGFIYTVIASAKNRLDTAVTQEEVNTTAIVKPAPVYNVSSVPVNSSSVQLTWHVVFPSGFPGDHLIYSITAVRVGDADVTVTKTGTNPWASDLPVTVLVDGLQPFTDYVFTVTVKPQLGGFWSEDRHFEIRTPEVDPEVGPGVSLSSFTDCPTDPSVRDVYLYWRAPDSSKTHGHITGYDVSVTNLDTQEVFNTKSGRRLRLERVDRYKVDIKTLNNAGVSRSQSSLLLPRSSEVLAPVQKPEAEQNGTHVIVTWGLLPSDASRRSVTVHSCVGVVMQPSKVVANCSDSYNWVKLEESAKSWSVAIDNRRIYVFGVSVETADQTSGIQWISCLFQKGKVPSKIMEVKAREVWHKSVDLVWTRLVCGQSAPSKVLRFEVSYFSVPEKSRASCDIGTTVEIAGDWELESASLNELHPSTPYHVCVRAVSPAGPGQWSDAIDIRTKANVEEIVIIVVVLVFVFVVGFFLCCYVRRQLGSPMTITVPEPVVDEYSACQTSYSHRYSSAEQEVLLCNGAVVQGNPNVGFKTDDRPVVSRNLSVTSDSTIAILDRPLVLSQHADAKTSSDSMANGVSPCLSYSQLAKADASTTSNGRISRETSTGDSVRVEEHSEVNTTSHRHRSTGSDILTKVSNLKKPEVCNLGEISSTTTRHAEDLCENDEESCTNEFADDIDSISYRKAPIISD